MGELSGLKGTQSNTLCSGFVSKILSWGFLAFFPTGTYAVIGTNCVEFENVMKSAQNFFILFKAFLKYLRAKFRH